MADMVTRRGPRGPYAKSKDTQRRILEAAFVVFAESGFRSGSLRDVAAEVGISEAGILHHYPNKGELLRATLEYRDDLTLELFGIPQQSGRERVQAWVDIAGYNEETPRIVELFCTLSAEATAADHPAHTYFRNRYAFVIDYLETALGEMADEGELIDGAAPHRIALQTVALMDGLQVQWLLDSGGVSMADEVKAFLDFSLKTPLDPPRPPAQR